MRLSALLLCLLLPASAAAQSAYVRSGTGFFVNKEYLVTNAHVVRGCSKVRIKGSVPLQEATVDAIDESRDLALIKTVAASPKVASMRFDIDTMRVGDKLYIIGYPGASGATGQYKFIEAQVPALPPGLPKIAGRFYISDNVEHGESGGPVFDNYGNVVGVVVAEATFSSFNKSTGVHGPGPKFGVAISLGTLKEFLSGHNVYPDWVGSGSMTVDPYIEENAKAYITNIQCHVDAR